MFFPHTKKILSRTFKIRGTLVFLCLRERERERERKGKKREIEREGERERTKVRAILFLKRPGQSEKSVNYMYCTVQERAV
jgi:hypothetical protein